MTTMKRHALLGALLALSCSGCTIPVVKNPLVKPADAHAVASLYGVYRSNDCPTNLVHWVHVGPAGSEFPAGFVRIVSIGQPRDAKTALDEPDTYIGFLAPVGKYHVLHLPFPKKAQDDKANPGISWDRKWDEDEVEGYLVLRLLLGDDGVEMAALDGRFVRDEIGAKKLTGEAKEEHRERNGVVEIKEGPVTITAGTAELREYFARHVDGKLFDKPYWKFVRMK